MSRLEDIFSWYEPVKSGVLQHLGADDLLALSLCSLTLHFQIMQRNEHHWIHTALVRSAIFENDPSDRFIVPNDRYFYWLGNWEILGYLSQRVDLPLLRSLWLDGTALAANMFAILLDECKVLEFFSIRLCRRMHGQTVFRVLSVVPATENKALKHLNVCTLCSVDNGT